MKKRYQYSLLLILTLLSCVALAACGNSTNYQNRYPGDKENKDYSGIEIKDSNGNNITNIAIDLWYCANSVYNVDDGKMFDIDYTETFLIENAPGFNELRNYDAVVNNVFTQNGIAQLENVKLGVNFIQKQDSKVYRMGPYKTGYSYADALVDMKVKEVSANKMTIMAQYEVFAGYIVVDPDYKPEYAKMDFTIVKSGGIWLVDDFVSPALPPQ